MKPLQDSYKMPVKTPTSLLSRDTGLLCTLVALLGAVALLVATVLPVLQTKTFLKMVEVSINDFLLGVPYKTPESDTK